ncbi:MAG: glycosyltransferase [Candidatus Diapherotrites archaeon]|uniref:Glycosyltransferase n=1 Tax=Candidatus Iainarchaeum sp. TaxID=3101447 RepID=A0A8T4L4I3_9ARCH|nr:glycosyltransferase [Candidatus Diapherotrites archaeon]
MKASIIVRAFNSEKTIRKCIKCILKARIPEGTEILAVFSKLSKDNTLEELKEFGKKIRIVKHSLKGFGAALNVGIENSKGSVLVFCDDDLMVSKEWITELLKPLKDEKIAGASGPVLPLETNFFGKCVAALGYPGGGYYRLKEEGFTKNPNMNLTIRKKVFQKAGKFREDFKFGNEDTEFFQRALGKGLKFWFSPKAIAQHPVRDSWLDFAKWWVRRGRADIAFHKQFMKSYPFSLFSPRHSRLFWLLIAAVIGIVLAKTIALLGAVWVLFLAISAVYNIARQQERYNKVKKFLQLPELAFWTLVPFLSFSSKVFRDFGRIVQFALYHEG